MVFMVAVICSNFAIADHRQNKACLLEVTAHAVDDFSFFISSSLMHGASGGEGKIRNDG